MRDFPNSIDECNHPDNALQKTKDIGTGLFTYECQGCGHQYYEIGEHSRILINGEYINDSSFKCEDCGLELESSRKFHDSECDD